MPKYRVWIEEVWVQAYSTEAENEDEAIRNVLDGIAEIEEGRFEFSHWNDDVSAHAAVEVPHE